MVGLPSVTTVRSLPLMDILLIGLYVGAELSANVTEAKPLLLFSLTVDGGTLIYALSFTLIDLIHERQGKRGAQKVVLAAFAANLLLALYIDLTLRLPAPAFFEGERSYEEVLGPTPRIVAASLSAYVASTLVDTEVYAWWKARIGGYRWLSVLASNAIGTLLDSFLFITLAFYGRFPLAGLILGNYAIKMAVTLLSLPLIYARGRP